MLIFLSCIIMVTNAYQNRPVVGIENLNPNFDYNQRCVNYDTCHNCTISRCQWNTQQGSCEGYDSYTPAQLHNLHIDDFFNYGSRCEDTRKVCETDLPRTNTHSYSFNEFTYLPLNYFCIFERMKWDQTPTSFGLESYRTLYSQQHIELEKSVAMWDQSCSQINGSIYFSQCNTNTDLKEGYMINDDIEHGKQFNFTNVSNLQIGVINIYKLTKNKKSKVDDHFELILTKMVPINDIDYYTAIGIAISLLATVIICFILSKKKKKHHTNQLEQDAQRRQSQIDQQLIQEEVSNLTGLYTINSDHNDTINPQDFHKSQSRISINLSESEFNSSKVDLLQAPAFKVTPGKGINYTKYDIQPKDEDKNESLMFGKFR